MAVYWARSRLLEYLGQIRGTLPAGSNPELGPTGTITTGTGGFR